MDNLGLMRERLRVRGGTIQQARMINDKKEALKRAIKYSYQGAQVQAVGKEEPAVALINPNTVKQDYDDKVISIDFNYNYSVGTVFEWLNTGTKWLIYLQDLTELAYFKGDIRKCNYEIKWKNAEGDDCITYVALTGPQEKKINSTTQGNISIDSPNYTLHFYMPCDEETAKRFDRYSKFYLNGLPTCWRIEAVDKISMPGILEIYAQEYYANEHEDNIEEGLVGDLIVQPIIPEIKEIDGNTFIKPKQACTYEYLGTAIGTWDWDKKLPIKEVLPKEENNDSKKITIKWDASYSGQFVLKYYSADAQQPIEIEKTIVVESLF